MIITQLENIVGTNNLLLDDESKFIYGKDLTHSYDPNPLAIVFPKCEQEILEIVKVANATLTSLVPSGGRTGYSGGAMAKNKEIVVSFNRMNRIINFNPDDKIITCEPGVTTKTIQDFAFNNNLLYPVDFASVENCQIGGNIATNAGGIKVIRYGLTRNWVCGLRVITGNGDLLELNHGLIKNASGYDLRHLFIGSEGTLGFITGASLKLTTLPTATKVILFAVQNHSHFIDIFNIFFDKLQISAFEFFSDAALQCVIDESKLPHPFAVSSPFYILLEYESNENDKKLLVDLIAKCLKMQYIVNAQISKNLQQSIYFWRYRKEVSSSLQKYFPYKYDIAVLPSKIPAFINRIDDIFTKIYPDLKIIWFGHIGDGNLHLNILKPKHFTKDEFFLYCNKMSEHVYAIIQEYQGAISAEHGIGLLKKDFLHFTKTNDEINYMRLLKKVFDRNNIMNPGKIF